MRVFRGTSRHSPISPVIPVIETKHENKKNLATRTLIFAVVRSREEGEDKKEEVYYGPRLNCVVERGIIYVYTPFRHYHCNRYMTHGGDEIARAYRN